MAMVACGKITKSTVLHKDAELNYLPNILNCILTQIKSKKIVLSSETFINQAKYWGWLTSYLQVTYGFIFTCNNQTYYSLLGTHLAIKFSIIICTSSFIMVALLSGTSWYLFSIRSRCIILRTMILKFFHIKICFLA